VARADRPPPSFLSTDAIVSLDRRLRLSIDAFVFLDPGVV
jgi:hypothetical protein